VAGVAVTNALPARVISTLTSALSYSARSDEEFASWADDIETYYGCTPGYVPTTDHWSNGQVFSSRATTAKEQFVREWNHLAARFRLPYRSAETI
jgi:hypothetical protein